MQDILAELNEETTIGEVLEADHKTARIFQEFGMHCLNCGSAQHESLADAAAVHGVNAGELIDQLLTYFAERDDSALEFPMF